MAVNIKKDFKNQRLKKPDVSSMIYGKIPPQASELEAAVLGAIMLEKDKLTEVLSIINSHECFYLDHHQKVYAAIQRLYASGSPVDLLTVTEELRKADELEKVGGAYALIQLTQSIVSSAHVEAHARIVMEKFMSREVINIAGKLISEAYEDSTDVFDLLDTAEGELFRISAGNLKRPYQHAPELAQRTRVNYQARVDAPREVTGITSGYRALDKITKGWNAGNLIIIAARPSVGKTAFAINLLINAALAKSGVGFFSLEMQEAEIMNRITACMGHIPLTAIDLGNLQEQDQLEFYRVTGEFAKLNIKIDDGGGLTFYELRTKARRMVEKDGVKMLIIDYLQLMQGDGSGNREQEISKISRDLKALAKELKLPIIALSQLNRGLENRTGANKKPQLSDLRESGAIEQDADIVMFLTRPDYQQTEGEAEPMMKDDADIHIAKNRNGIVETLAMKLVKSIQTWFDPAGYDSYRGPVWHNPEGFHSLSPGITNAGKQLRDFTVPQSQQESKDDLPF